MMDAEQQKIIDVQKHLRKHEVDGWLLYDFKKNNPIANDFLNVPAQKQYTRRFFYWIPAQGEPIKIVHEIEPDALDHLPGSKRVYLRWQILEKALHEVLKDARVVAMEYSHFCAVPYISKVDAGTIELVRSCGVEVVSSAPFLQYYSCVLSEEQLQSLKEAAEVIEETIDGAWDYIRKALENGSKVTDYDVQQYILGAFEKHDCMTYSPPNCSINANTTDPHFVPGKEKAVTIRKGDFILIDLWCKKKKPGSIYADVTRVGLASKEPSPKIEEIFSIVRRAQKTAAEFIRGRFAEGKEVKGFEVDEACRRVIIEAGYGDYFNHRTGHNITTEIHGPGTHLDSLETYDDRPLIAGTCCSIEPGIYLPGEFGVRLEYDLYIDKSGGIQIFGGEQDSITRI